MEVVTAAGVGKAVLNCLLSGAKASVEEDKASKQVVRRNLPFLKEELAAMQSFLRAADDERNKHKVLPTDVTRVRTLSYDVHDCIQDATVHLEKPSGWWQLPRTMRERQRIAEEMKRLRAQIEDMGQRSLRYRIAEDPNSKSATVSATTTTTPGTRARRAAASDKPEVNRMVQLINTEHDDLQVIAVWGTSDNLEQTSTVRAAYENPAVKEKFPYRAWVRVMRPFHLKEFVQSLVRQFLGDVVGATALFWEEGTTLHGLAREFDRCVSENAYLIVLNDLNTIEEWDRIKTYFPDNNKRSRIIVSTKQAEVASLIVGYESAELKLKELAADQILYAFHDKVNKKNDRNDHGLLVRNLTMALSEESYLVGRKREKREIIDLITGNCDPVISVWGIRGIGKTTLVRDVYDSQELNGMFRTRAYVTVVHPFILKELLMSLVMQLDAGTAYEHKNMMGLSSWRTQRLFQIVPLVELTKELNRLLDGKSFFIVLDGVLSIEDWKQIATLFGTKISFGTIIVITRDERIAKVCSKKEVSTYQLKPLESYDACDLFIKKVFGKTLNMDEQYPDLAEQANLILKKCNGLPLAIVAIGVFLANQPKTLSEWRKLNGHIDVELEMKREIETIMASKIYDDLPYHLKSLILYLPIFPEDYKVRRRRLVRRWSAEGYSGEVRGKSVEETGDTYFMELISRSIILPCESSTDTREGIDLCQVHDFISKTAMSKSIEENLVFKLEEGCSQNTRSIARHLAVSSNWKGDGKEFASIVDMSRLRSMTVFGKWRSFFSLRKMRLLRVLDLEDTSGLFDHHLKHIGKLLHLRYLSLRGCGDIYHLPDSLGNLTQLETLDVKGTNIFRLPKTISKLTKLQHVLAGYVEAKDESMTEGLPKLMKLRLMTVVSAGFCVACWAPHLVKPIVDTDGDHVNRRDVCTMYCCAVLPTLGTHSSTGGVAVPRGISKLKALLTLGTVNVSGPSKAALQDIKGFTRLRKLGVAGINRTNGQELCSAITHLRLLESLSVWLDGKRGLVGCLDGMTSPPENLQSLKLYGRLDRLPDWIHGLQNLVKLKLRGSRLHQSDDDDDDAMRVFESLPNLAILVLLENSFEGEELRFIFEAGSFPSLLVLQLQSLSVFKMVAFVQGATPKLEVLRFGLSSDWYCKFYGLEYLPSIREVVLSYLGLVHEYMVEDIREQLAMNQNRPVLKMGN